MSASCLKPSYVGARDDIESLIPIQCRRLLDVGCSVGRLGETLKRRDPGKVVVVGVEIDRSMAEIASGKLDRVIVGDIETVVLDGTLEGSRFDCIILGDVLEHLRDPWRTLKQLVALLDWDGIVVASIPNVRHYTTVVQLVFRGYWPYRDRGIHDRTHLRFFTLTNVRELFEGAGLTIEKIDRKHRLRDCIRGYSRIARLIALWPLRDFLAYQYLVVAKRKQ